MNTGTLDEPPTPFPLLAIFSPLLEPLRPPCWSSGFSPFLREREREREGLCTSACHSSRTIARRRRGSHERFTLYSSNDGAHSNMKISRIEITTRGSQIIHGISFSRAGIEERLPLNDRASIFLSVPWFPYGCGTVGYRCVGLFYEEDDAERRL